MSIPKGRISEVTLYSEALNEDITLLIYLPASFSPLYKYTVLIAQDGRDYFQLGRIARTADKLLDDGLIENIIIVGVPYKNVEDRRKKYHPKGELNRAYIRFLAHELVPYIDREFPTYQIGMGRALIGDSLGATVSLMTALLYPHTFGKVLLQSPYVNLDVLTAAEEFQEAQLLSIYHVIGKGETDVKTGDGQQDFLTPNRKLAEIITDKQFPYFYEEFNGDHTWTHWQPDLKRALNQMF